MMARHQRYLAAGRLGRGLAVSAAKGNVKASQRPAVSAAYEPEWVETGEIQQAVKQAGPLARTLDQKRVERAVEDASDYLNKCIGELTALTRDLGAFEKPIKASHTVSAGSPHAQGEARKYQGQIKAIEDQVYDASKRYMDQGQADLFEEAASHLMKARQLLSKMPE
jgi:hypothetical protein